MKSRCLWSNRKDPDTRAVTVDPSPYYKAETVYVCPAHEPELRRWIQFQHTWSGRFMAACGILAFLLILFVLLEVWWALAVGLFAFGVLVQFFPFSTAQTVWVFGIRTSIWMARAVGVLLMGMGVWILVAQA